MPAFVGAGRAYGADVLRALPDGATWYCMYCLMVPQEIYYFHQAIRSALHSFAAEARALRAAEGRVTTSQVQTALAPSLLQAC